MNRLSLLPCLIAYAAFSQVAPLPWENAYSASGYGYTTAHDVCPAHGSGMVIVGSCFSQDMESSSRIYALKLSETGTVIWGNAYQVGNNDVNIGWGVSRTSTGYVLAGETGTAGNRSAFIATIDQNGSSFTSGIIQGECAVEVVQMESQQGYIILGQTDTEQEHSYVFVDKVNNYLVQIPSPSWNRWVHSETPDVHSYAYGNSIIEIPSDYGPDLGNHIALCFGRGNDSSPEKSMLGLLNPRGSLLASSTGADYF